nr:hypothetical protein [Tanacetum cinerariifolium]
MQTQTSNTLHNAIMEAGGKDRPSMLAPGNYIQCKSRIKRYIDSKPNHELIHYCLKNLPYKYTWADKTVPVSEAEVVQIILTWIDNHIYSTFDACPNACEMWKAIERLKQGESINSQELKTVSYHKLYDILKQCQNEVNELRAERLACTANPLVLVAQQQPVYHPQNHLTQYTQNSSTRSQQAATRNRGKAIVNSPPPIYDQEPSTVAEDDEMSKDKEIDKLMTLISLSFKKIHKPTNNNLQTSSNTSNVAGARETVGTMMVQKSRIQCYICKEFGHVARECQKPKRVKDAAYHKEKMLLCKKEEARIQLNAEQADWRDDTDDESEDQELEAHYMYMAQIQEVNPDVAADSGPIFDIEPLQKVQNDDNYNVFAIESEHPEQSKSVNDTYLIEQDEHNMIIDSLDMSYDREHIDQNDDDDDLANECELLASLIEKLKCEIDDSKNRNKFLETSNKVLVDKLKGEIEDFKTKNKSLESSNNRFKEANNKVSKTNELMYKDLKKFQSELDKRNDVKNEKELSAHQETISILSQAKEAQIKLYKTREDKELDKVIALENKVKVLDNIVCKTGQSVQTMNMLNSKSKMSFAKPEFLKKAQRANLRMYDIDEVTNLRCDYLETLEKCECLEKELSKSKMMSKSFEALQKHVINLELELQQFTAQILPPNKKSILKNTNVLAPGMYKLHTEPTQTRTTQLPHDSRKTNKRVSFSTGVIPTTTVSRPQLKSNPMEDRVIFNNSQRKKQEVEDHRRNVKFSKNKTSVTACNDSLNTKTSNVNFVCATYRKCVLNEKHNMCVLKSSNGVNSRTKIPIVVHVSTRETKRTVNKSVKKPNRRTIASKSTNQKPRNTTRKLYEHVTKTCSWWYPNFTPPRYKWKPKSQIGNVNPNVSMPLGNASRTANILEPITPRRFTVSKTTCTLILLQLVEIILFIVDSGCSKHMTGNLKLLINFVEKFLGMVKFGNDQIAPILGYGDLVQGAVMIKRVYYVEGLNHNLFFVGQFCDVDLEVAFRKSTCYIRDLNGNDLLTERTSCSSKNVRTDKGTEFLNKTLHAYFASKRILHQTSVARTPDQNGVVERQNRTLVEAARTMLSAAKVPLFFWAEAITTACFSQNRSLEKGDACIFVGYSTQSRAYRVFNKRTRVIVETIHVNFDELPQMASDHVSSDPVPQCQRTALKHDSLSPGPQCQENVPHVARTVTKLNELDLLFSLMFAKLLNSSSQVVSKSFAESTTDAPNQCQQQNITPLNNQTSTEPTCQVPTQASTVMSTENINQAKTIEENAQVENDKFINIFCTQTKDHPLEQVIGNPSQSVRTRRQLELDGKMCMFALTVSRTKPKNIKEGMADSAWIESMQEELY